MSVEPTSALTLGDLVLEVALQMGVAYYGEGGDEAAQAPVDEHDLAECKRHVNNGLRMFIGDAPPTGWRWLRPTASVALWASLGILASRTMTGGTYDAANDQTPLTANTAVFYPTMEERQIVVTGQGTFTVKQYVSATQVYVYGQHSFATPATYSIAANGDYTLPRTFAGTFTGEITFGPNTNQAMSASWTDESTVRMYRENVSVDSGTPLCFAIAVFTPVLGRPRYQLMCYPSPYQSFTVQFPYDQHFDDLVSLTATLPTPIIHDDTIRAACNAVIERDVDDMSDGPAIAYYEKKALANSQRLDSRSAPRKLGYFGNRQIGLTGRNFRDFMRRPNVNYNTP